MIKKYPDHHVNPVKKGNSYTIKLSRTQIGIIAITATYGGIILFPTSYPAPSWLGYGFLPELLFHRSLFQETSKHSEVLFFSYWDRSYLFLGDKKIFQDFPP